MWLRVVVVCWLAGLVQGSHIKKENSCSKVQQRCLFRDGCSMALTNYMLWCSEVMRGETQCSVPCQNAIIALTSTEEGKDLMNCTCNDDYCLKSKQRVEICKPHVLRAFQNETISCTLSQLICTADVECATALKFYEKFCRSMFHGKKCSRRCLNSIGILKRNGKNAKLDNCRCDGNEDYDCPKVKENMDRLCFHKVKEIPYVTMADDPKGSACAIQKAQKLVTLLTLVLVMKLSVPV